MCQTLPTKHEETLKIPADLEKPSRPIVVAVIDTGYDFKSNWNNVLKTYPQLRKPRICKYGHVDYTGKGLQDVHGHGTHIAGLIAQYADNSNYCMVIMKYFDTLSDTNDHLISTGLAFQRAIDLKVDVINYSGGGEEYSKQECDIIKKALDAGIVVVTAAGNEGKDINQTAYYPAMCDVRVKAIGNIQKTGEYNRSSNFTDGGPKSRFLYTQIGSDVLSLGLNNQLRFMTGTSQATAIHSGKTIKDWNRP